MTLPRRIQAFFDERTIRLRTVAHHRLYTSRQSASGAQVIKGVPPKHQAGYLIAVVPGDAWARLEALADLTGCRLSLAPQTKVLGLFGGWDAGAISRIRTTHGLGALLDRALTCLAHTCLESAHYRHLIHLSGEQFRALTGGARIGLLAHPG